MIYTCRNCQYKIYSINIAIAQLQERDAIPTYIVSCMNFINFDNRTLDDIKSVRFKLLF